jgi:hypothetical protein
MQQVKYDLVGFDGRRQCRGVAKIALIPFNPVERFGEQATTTKGANAMTARGQSATKIYAEEAPATEYDAGQSASNHYFP